MRVSQVLNLSSCRSISNKGSVATEPEHTLCSKVAGAYFEEFEDPVSELDVITYSVFVELPGVELAYLDGAVCQFVSNGNHVHTSCGG